MGPSRNGVGRLDPEVAEPNVVGVAIPGNEEDLLFVDAVVDVGCAINDEPIKKNLARAAQVQLGDNGGPRVLGDDG